MRRRRSTGGTTRSGSRRVRLRLLLPLLGLVAAASLTIVSLGSLRPSDAAASDTRECAASREILTVVSPWDRPSAAVAGTFFRCTEPASGREWVTNNTPVVWVDTSTTSTTTAWEVVAFMAAGGGSPASSTIVPPGATVRVRADTGWRPDLAATRLYVAFDAVTSAQDEAAARDGFEVARAADPAFDNAAASCAMVAVSAPDGAAPQTPSGSLDLERLRAALATVWHDPTCRHSWAHARTAAEWDGWRHPSIAAAFGPLARANPELSAKADRAAEWFTLSSRFVWEN